MRRFILIGIVAFLSLAEAQGQEMLENFRKNYPHARQDAKVCKQQIDIIDRSKLDSNLEIAYAGAFYAVWPEHLSSPLKKLNAFKKGKNYLEQAIQADKGNVEIHFLRLTIQHNAPAMLGYDEHIQDDLKIVLDHYKTMNSSILKTNIKKFLLPTDLLTAQQRKLFE